MIDTIKDAWKRRNDKDIAFMTEDEFRNRRAPDGKLLLSLAVRSEPEAEFHRTWRFHSYYQGRLLGTLDGVFWTLKVFAWITVGVLFILGVNGHFD